MDKCQHKVLRLLLFLGQNKLDHLDHFIELEVAHGEAMPNGGVLMRV
jgi:hypothetical protein